MLKTYEHGLRWSINHRATTMMASLAVLGATMWLFVAVPKGFIPNEDQNEVRISLEAAQGTSFPDLMRHQLKAMDIVIKDPNVATFFSFVGRGGSNTGIISLRLVPKSQRKMTIDEVMDHLRPQLSA